MEEKQSLLLSERPTWAEVDLNALAANYRALASLLSSAAGNTRNDHPRIIPVIKADAYGHGMIPVAQLLAREGVGVFAIGAVEEGVRLRDAGVTQEVLVLGTAWKGQEEAAIGNRLTLAIDTPDSVQCLEQTAANLGAMVSVHIKVDTGMGRLGVHWDAMEPLLASLKRARHIRIAGTFSHLSSADEPAADFTLEQTRRFKHALANIRQANLEPGEIHFGNSAGLLYHEHLRQWGARIGISLYGYSPDPLRSPLKLVPALTLKTKVGPIRLIRAGEPVGYGRRFIASRPTRAAILPVGYADGYTRRLYGRAKVIINDRCADLIGAVSMDMIAVDLADMPDVKNGDEVILLGSSAHCHMTAADWARILETIPYEVLCGIAARIPRVYLR